MFYFVITGDWGTCAGAAWRRQSRGWAKSFYHCSVQTNHYLLKNNDPPPHRPTLTYRPLSKIPRLVSCNLYSVFISQNIIPNRSMSVNIYPIFIAISFHLLQNHRYLHYFLSSMKICDAGWEDTRASSWAVTDGWDCKCAGWQIQIKIHKCKCKYTNPHVQSHASWKVCQKSLLL